MTSVDDILQRVARGELSPDDGLAALDRLAVGRADAPPDPDLDPDLRVECGPGADLDLDPDARDASGGPAAYPFPDAGEPAAPEPDVRPPADAPPPPPSGRSRRARPAGGVRCIRLRIPARAVDIYADPSVAEARVASGACALRRLGDVLVIEHARSRGTIPDDGRYRFVDQWPRKVAALAEDRAVVRVNPALLLDVEMAAGSLRIWGASAGLRLRMTAGSAKIDRIEGPLDLDLHSASLKGTALLSGQSSLRCESSSVKLTLQPGSDVRIDAVNRMGKLVLPGRRSRTGAGERSAAIVGAGRGRLTVDARMSSVMIGAYR
jgi:hypothetical protein